MTVPSAILSGSATVTGTKIIQRFIGGLAGVTYLLSYEATYSDGEQLTLQAQLPVVPELV